MPYFIPPQNKQNFRYWNIKKIMLTRINLWVNSKMHRKSYGSHYLNYNLVCEIACNHFLRGGAYCTDPGINFQSAGPSGGLRSLVSRRDAGSGRSGSLDRERELDLLVTARLMATCLSISISWKQSNTLPEIKKKRKIIGRPAIPNRHVLAGTSRKNWHLHADQRRPKRISACRPGRWGPRQLNIASLKIKAK